MNRYIMKRLSDLNEIHTVQAATIFTDCTMQYFKSMCTDREKFIRIYTKALVREKIWACVHCDEVVGIICYTSIEEELKLVTLKPFIKEFGLIKGYIAYSNLNKKPKELQSNEVYIEIIFTSEKYRRQGVATTMIEYIIDTRKEKTFTLEVTNVNKIALELYEKLGFIIVKRNKQPFAKQAGFKERFYMKKALSNK